MNFVADASLLIPLFVPEQNSATAERIFYSAEAVAVPKLVIVEVQIAEGYQNRLINVAGFSYAPRPLRFVNSLGATIYYLFVASPNRTGDRIVEHIFAKHRKKQGL